MDDIVTLFDMDDFGMIKGGAGDDSYRMYGFASSPAKDIDDEIVIQKGLDIGPLSQRGWVNWDHNRLNTIGWVQMADFRVNPNNPDMKKGVYTEYQLFKDDPVAQRVWTMAKAIESSDCPRNLGLSLEGTRHLKKAQSVMSATVYGMAVTPYAKNIETSAHTFMKSILGGDLGIAEALNDGPYIEATGIDFSAVSEMISDRIVDRVVSEIRKAISSGYDVGGTSQANGAAIRKESLIDKMARVDPSSIPEDLSGYSDYDKEVISALRKKAESNGWLLTKSDAAILIVALKGHKLPDVLKALEFTL